MKNYLILLLLFCGASLYQAFGVGLSSTNNDVYIAIAAWRNGFITNEPIRFNDGLIWDAFCNTNPVELNYLDPKYAIKIKMLGSDGKEVAKTKLGKSYGTGFDQVHSYKDVIDILHIGQIGYNSSHMGVIEAQGRYDARGGGFTGRSLPSPKDLFEIEQPGIYTLEIQMQLFRHSGSVDTNVWSENFIRFSPIKIKVEKPSEK